MARRPSSTLRVIENTPRPEEFEPIEVDVPSEELAPGVTFKDGVLHTEHEDGSTTIDFDPPAGPSEVDDDDDFYGNLVGKFDSDRLGQVATELIDGINRDIESRQEWLATRARGIQLLGLKLEEPKSDTGLASAPLEGMSTVRHPLLLEATIRFQATARGELLPAGGPVKVRNDTPMPPQQDAQPAPLGSGLPPGLPGMAAAGAGPSPPAVPLGGNVVPFPRADGGAVGGGGAGIPAPQGATAPAQAGPAPAPAPAQGAAKPDTMDNPTQAANPMATEVAQPPMQQKDALAEALEKDFNHYLTVTCSDYVKDTDRMLFYIGFGGDGFKKVYHCPMKRRPVSESVDAEDLIVSNSAADLQNCGRVTHRIKMRKSIVKRMQILGVYADVALDLPTPPKITPVDEQKNEIDGTNPSNKKPEDLDYEIYECYCEQDFEAFAPSKFKNKGLPLPYRITIEKNSQKILSIVRNWKQTDEEALPKQFFVQFPFVRGLGFYGLGFVHLLGNTTSTLTAMWREMTDSGMFSNFPGFLFAKGAGRQLSNQIRVPPGGGFGLDVPLNMRIQDAVMPLPYKDIGSAFTAFCANVEQAGQRLGQTADISIGEGKQDAPVGTTLALIEQATKVLDSVHKRLHWAQNEEFQLLKERFQEDPEAFWRHNNKPAMPWRKEQFLQALNDYDLVPVADPNNPTSLHRTAKAAVVEGLAAKYPQDVSKQGALRYVFRIAGIDPEGIIFPQSLPPPPDPRMQAIDAKNQQIDKTNAAQQQTTVAKTMGQLINTMKMLEDKQQDRASKEKIAQMTAALEFYRDHQQMVNDRQQAMFDMRLEGAKAAQQAGIDHQKSQQEMYSDLIAKAMEMQADHIERGNRHQADMMDREHEARIAHHSARQGHFHEQQMHEAQMERDRQIHEQKLAHERALNNEKIRAARAMARATPKQGGGSKTTTKTTKSNAMGTHKTETTKTKEG